MSVIRNYIEDYILKKCKSYSKPYRIFFSILIIIAALILYFPYLCSIYTKWETVITALVDTGNTSKNQPDTTCDGPLIPPLTTEEITGEGRETDFIENSARKKALETAKKNLLSKCSGDKETVMRYKKIVKDTTTKTITGMWEAHIIMIFNKEYIK